MVTEIPASTFANYTSIKTLKLGSGLTAIGDEAFSGCTGLEEVIIPENVETIGASAFANIPKLASIIMGHSVKTIGEKAFDGAAATTVSITAQEPPTAPNNTFSAYSGKLYVQGEGTADKYYDAYTCWDRFDNYVMIVAEKLAGNNDKVISGKPGQQVQLQAKVWPENVTLPQVFWRSTNPEIATVDNNGLVTFHSNLQDILTRAGGSCKIIAETLYADGPVLEFNLVATEGEILPTAISLDATTKELVEGDTFTLKATVTPEEASDKSVTWSSSDETVATVDASGAVTAKNIGKATITAKTANGKEATCEITVVAKVILADGISLNKTAETIKEEETLQLTATVTPADATDKSVTWSSSDETVATVDQDGLVKALKAGTATITAETSNGLKATCTVTVEVKSGIDGVEADGQVSVTVRDGVILVEAPDGAEVEVYSMTGLRVAMTREHRIEGLASGVYIVRVGGKAFKVMV